LRSIPTALQAKLDSGVTFGARFGVLGVYVSGRSREKVAGATGELPSNLIGDLLKALKKK